MAEGATAGARTRHPVGHPWRPTALQREYRALLDSAKLEPQDIIDSDGEMLVVQRKDVADFETQLAERVRELARFQAVYAANRDRPASQWATQTAFPYLAVFSVEEVAEFASELHAYTLAAAQRGELQELRGNLRAWEDTAKIYEQPEVLAAIAAPIDYDKLEEVFSPSEAEVAASQA
jgi:soluble lytic murein transglycosylase-like protein